MAVFAVCLLISRIRLRAIASYDGRNFHGVQKNVRTQDGTELRTILSTLEGSLWPALEQEVKFRVAGRTDAGVSASGQVISFDAEPTAAGAISVRGAPVHASALTAALNGCLPSDLQLRSVEIVPREFDVTRDCMWKRYRYSLPALPLAADDHDGLRLLEMVARQAARAPSDPTAPRTERVPAAGGGRLPQDRRPWTWRQSGAPQGCSKERTTLLLSRRAAATRRARFARSTAAPSSRAATWKAATQSTSFSRATAFCTRWFASSLARWP